MKGSYRKGIAFAALTKHQKDFPVENEPFVLLLSAVFNRDRFLVAADVAAYRRREFIRNAKGLSEKEHQPVVNRGLAFQYPLPPDQLAVVNAVAAMTKKTTTQ